ncbi:sugar kinase [Microbacterium pseudoresistens]|uniref:2-dehydro-3-deoxygluconokinase n=1 Tax=Microbacterium pseudoresistens TaxID=640634 RepID=A0A7Y9EUV8_9MICO|nr:sugar kinase [Microbacterium pseudoresistens]NYD54407.1 2-dehydro-3-deoxygluconokinase [Microbacterium pseudoresistens]
MRSSGELDIVAFGEALGVFETTGTGRLRSGDDMRFTFAGAESNVAIGAARQGKRVAWVSALGGDPMAAAIERELRAEGVDVCAWRDARHATGAIVKVRRTGHRTQMIYMRAMSAFAMAPARAFDFSPIERSRFLHVSGVTLGVGADAREAMREALEVAHRNGVMVSFDVNFRRTMWSAEEASPFMQEVARRADVVFASPDEAELLVGSGSVAELARAVKAMGPSSVVMKLGARGALALDAEGIDHYGPAAEAQALDVVGAGDAFAAGYLCALLDGCDATSALDTANRTAAAAISSRGDWEGLPSAEELAEGGIFETEVWR